MTNQSKPYQTSQCQGLKGEIIISPDKSISHRSLIFAALATGVSQIKNLLLGEDVLCTLKILNQLGVRTSKSAETIQPGDTLTVEGVGLKGLKETNEILYCGNSGTAMRLLLGLASGVGLNARFTGDASLNKRPMERVTKPLEKMGAKFSIESPETERIIRTHAHAGLTGIHYDSPVASAQIKTAVLIAGLNATGETTVSEPEVSRNHTELMLKAMGADITTLGTAVTLRSCQALKPIQMTVPGDISSAAFFIVAALITPESDVIIRNVNLNPTRTGLLDVLLDMGGDITVLSKTVQGGEDVGDLRVRTSALHNIPVGGNIIPRLIDEIPILALAAAFAEGNMTLSDAAELRVKETDRIRAVCCELGKLGVNITEKQDGFIITGGRGLAVKQKNLCTYGDHRMAMMLIIAGLNLGRTLELDDVNCIKTSFPEFFDLLAALRR